MCQEAIRMTYVNAGRLGLLGAPTYPMLRDATQSTFFEILATNGVPYEHNKAENTVVMKDTRSRVLFRPVEEFDRLRGTNLAWFGVDELTYTPEDAWQVLEGRLRDPKAKQLCGFAVWTPKGYDWVYRRFVAEPVEGYEAIMAGASENHHLLDRVPDFYERLKRSYDEDFYRQEVLGEYVNLNGKRVYSAFDRREHVRRLSVNPVLPLMWALDFNVDPMCSVVVQIEGPFIKVVDEIVLSRATTRQACEEFQSRYASHWAGLLVFGDASGRNQQTTGLSDYQTIEDFFRRAGRRNVKYRIPTKNPPVKDRINLMNGKLKSAGGEVHMLVDEKAKELIKDFEEVVYKAGSTIVDKERDSRRTHMSDALGYLVWQECEKAVQYGEQGMRLLSY